MYKESDFNTSLCAITLCTSLSDKILPSPSFRENSNVGWFLFEKMRAHIQDTNSSSRGKRAPVCLGVDWISIPRVLASRPGFNHVRYLHYFDIIIRFRISGHHLCFARASGAPQNISRNLQA